MAIRSATLVLLLTPSFSSQSNEGIVLASRQEPQQTQQQEKSQSWHRFAANINYRLTALLDVNGGDANDQNENSNHYLKSDDSSTAKTPGYSIPIDVLTLQDPITKTYRQRISYYSGMQVDYNVDGMGFKVISSPYVGDAGSIFGEGPSSNKELLCLSAGGDDAHATEKIGYLNFFPTEEQLENYTLGELITNQVSQPFSKN